MWSLSTIEVELASISHLLEIHSLYGHNVLIMQDAIPVSV